MICVNEPCGFFFDSHYLFIIFIFQFQPTARPEHKPAANKSEPGSNSRVKVLAKPPIVAAPIKRKLQEEDNNSSDGEEGKESEEKEEPVTTTTTTVNEVRNSDIINCFTVFTAPLFVRALS